MSTLYNFRIGGDCDELMLVVDGMRQEDLELNRDRIQVVRSQLREFSETLQEVAREVSRGNLKRKVSKQSLEIQVIRDKLSGVENFLSLLEPEGGKIGYPPGQS
jgi:hypothetical protein